MKKCPVCGAENGDDALFCIECGAKLYQSTSGAWESPEVSKPKREVVYCPQCGVENDPENKFCVMCGYPLKEEESKGVCPVCGAPIQGDEAFCMTCGAPLKSPSITPPAGMKRPEASQKGQKSDLAMHKTIMGVPSPALSGAPSKPRPQSGPPKPPAVPGAPSAQAQSSSPTVSSTARTILAQPSQISGSHPPVIEQPAPSVPTATIRLRSGEGEWKLHGQVVVGRGAVGMPWSDSPYLGERDALITVQEGAIHLEPAVATNPLFVQVPSRTRLSDGQWLRMGWSLFVLRLAEVTSTPSPRLGGVRMMTSQEQQPWGWLRHVGSDGQLLGLYPLWGDEIVLGKGRSLPPIPSLQEEHARLVRRDGAVHIEPVKGEVWVSVNSPSRLALPLLLMVGWTEYSLTGEDER